MNTSPLSPRMRLVLGALALGASLLPGLAQAAPDAQCPWLGISPACDRQIQAVPPAGAAINTAHPNDIGMDSYNVPPVSSVRARPPAPACPFGYQSGPSFDTSSWTWQYSCVPQTAQPAASACPNGFASGPTFNSGTNSWNYTCAAAPAPPPPATGIWRVVLYQHLRTNSCNAGTPGYPNPPSGACSPIGAVWSTRYCGRGYLLRETLRCS